MRTIRMVVLLFVLTSVLATCQKSSTVVREFEVQAADVSLHVRMAGNPDSGWVLIAINWGNWGPGLTGVSMPVMDGLEATRLIKAEWPAVRAIVLSIHGALRTEALAAADALLVKGCSAGELLAAILDR